MDCIFSDNYKHFEGPCSFLKIPYERPFEVEIGSEQDVRKMLKDFNFKKRR